MKTITLKFEEKMKTIFKYVLLAIAIVYPPFEEEAAASTQEYVEVCSIQRIWIPPGESDKGYPYLGYWTTVRICGLKILPKLKNEQAEEREEEKEEQT